MKKILISIGLFFIIAMFEITAQTAVAPSAGDGSASNPYQISTINNLYWLTQQEQVSDGTGNYWSRNYIQTADINASSSSGWDSGNGFLPIGNSLDNFVGTYNGDGHTISGIYINRDQLLGLFGVTDDGAIIKNVGVVNADITGPTGTVGSIVGQLAGSDNKIINCYSTGADSGYGDVGGLVGYVAPGDSIINCHSECTINGHAYIGGLVGNNYGVIYKSYATGNVIGSSGGRTAGGLVGLENLYSEIIMCYATGNVSGVQRIGGLVGYDDHGTVKNSYARGDVSCTYDWIGGLVGRGYYNHIINSYATGKVTATDSSNMVGGLISHGTGTDGSASFWDVYTTNQISSDYGTGETTTNMKSKSTFFDAGWDFASPVWHMNSYLNDGYPYLDFEEFVNESIDVPTIVSDSIFVLDGAEIGFQSQTNTVDVQFELKDNMPPNFPLGDPYVGVYWDITNVSGGNVKLRLYYDTTDVSDFEGTPTIFHYDGSDWVELATTSPVPDGNLMYIETVNYYGSFSPVTIGDASNPLPVELVSFTGNVKDNNITLNWKTATEVNNYGFEIERKSKNKEWVKIGFVEGHGTNNSPMNYSYVDNKLPDVNNFKYRLKEIDLDGKFKYSNEIEVRIDIPTEFALEQNYPNPFNPTTTIRYTIPSVIASGAKQSADEFGSSSPLNDNMNVTLKVYDILGNEVTTLVNQHKSPGSYKVTFNASNLSSGVYFYRLKAGKYNQLKKMILLK